MFCMRTVWPRKGDLTTKSGVTRERERERVRDVLYENGMMFCMRTGRPRKVDLIT